MRLGRGAFAVADSPAFISLQRLIVGRGIR
jgi:hypothetical protein